MGMMKVVLLVLVEADAPVALWGILQGMVPQDPPLQPRHRQHHQKRLRLGLKVGWHQKVITVVALSKSNRIIFIVPHLCNLTILPNTQGGLQCRDIQGIY